MGDDERKVPTSRPNHPSEGGTPVSPVLTDEEADQRGQTARDFYVALRQQQAAEDGQSFPAEWSSVSMKGLPSRLLRLLHVAFAP